MSNPADDDFVGIPEEMDTLPPEPAAPRRWQIPLALGCGCIGLPLAAIAVVLSGITSTVIKAYRSTGAHQVYQLATERVQADAQVSSALGSPIEPGWPSKTIENHQSGKPAIVCQRFALSGRDRSGSSYVEAQQIGGAWQLHQLSVAVNGQPEPLILQPLPTGEKPLCPDFDQPDSSNEDDFVPDGSTPI
jgi:type II secretory pathway pseudopilin PulG